MCSSFRDMLGGSIFGGSRRDSAPTSRIYGPRDLEDTFLIEEVEDAFKPVLAKIGKIHGEVDIAAYRNGFCFGLLDPISNIVINSAISATTSASRPLAEVGRDEGQAADMAMRSLHGLVAFLTYIFPYLPEEEALGYLDAAGADLMVACILIIRRRGMQEFDPCSSTALAAFETALRCAAIAAKHPDPEHLVQRWKPISHDLHRFCYKLRSRPQNMINNIIGMLDGAEPSNDGITMEKSWLFAKDRLINKGVRQLLPPARAAMKRMLLAEIHGFYLQVLAMFPTDDLLCRYHRSILMGGYCYGPLDPVSNIILNTFLYDQRFPSNKKLPLQMISTECLWRITAQSLYGLISFLCTRYPTLTPDLALQRLLVARADLRAADPNLPMVRGHNVPFLNWFGCYHVGSRIAGGVTRETQHRAVESLTPSADAEEAYAAAATAAFHPDPTCQQKLLGSPSGMGTLLVASDMLKQDCILSVQDISLLSELLFRFLSSIRVLDQQQKPVCRNKSMRQFMSICRGRFWGQHDRVCSKVNAALDAFNEDKEFKYSVHVICGVNELVSGPEFCKDEEGRGYNPTNPYRFHHSHINFLATCAGSKPTLFFAECGNHETKAWCIPVEPLSPLAEHVRCIYCERQGISIVHPTVKGFHGRNKEFEKVLRGEAIFDDGSENYNNYQLITHKQEFVDWVHTVRDDYIYCDDEVDALGEDKHEENKRPYISFR